MSPELKIPLQLREIQPQPQNNHQPQVKLLFSSPATHRLSAPTRAFTRGLYLASQQAALLQLNSFALQTCSKGSLTRPGACSPPGQAQSSSRKKPLFYCVLPHPNFTSTSPSKRICRICKLPFSGCFPLGEKARTGKGGKRAGPQSKLL